MTVCVVTDAQPAGGGGLFHACRQIHGDTANAPIGVDTAAEQHVSGMHADPEIQWRGGRLPHVASGQASTFGQESQPRSHGALGIVLLSPVTAEHGQKAITCVLQDLSTMRRDDVRASGHRAIQYGVDFLGVEMLT